MYIYTHVYYIYMYIQLHVYITRGPHNNYIKYIKQLSPEHSFFFSRNKFTIIHVCDEIKTPKGVRCGGRE